MTASRIRAAAVVPSAALLIPEASPVQPDGLAEGVRALRHDARAVLDALPATDVVVLLAEGARGVYDQARADLSPLGVDVHAELPVATEVLEHVTRLTQYPMFRGRPLELDLSVLTLLVRETRGEVPVLPVSVPAQPDAAVLRSVGSSLEEAFEDVDLTATVVASGDLSASLDESSPRYRVEGAAAWDERVVAALRDDHLADLEALGPQEARRVEARGWAPLTVLGGVVSSTRLGTLAVGYHAPKGVGGVVALLGRDDDGRPRFEIRGGRDGVLPRTGDPRG